MTPLTWPSRPADRAVLIPAARSLSEFESRSLFAQEALPTRTDQTEPYPRPAVAPAAQEDAPPAGVHPDATVNAAVVRALLAAMGPFRGRGETILRACGIGEVDEEEWVPLHAYVRAVRTIRERMGPNTVFQIGRQIARHVQLPGGTPGFEKVLALVGISFDMNHRGVPQGAVTFQLENPRTATLVSASPYPCELDRGVISGFFQLLPDAPATVEAVRDEPCKSRGGRTCTFRVTLAAF